MTGETEQPNSGKSFNLSPDSDQTIEADKPLAGLEAYPVFADGVKQLKTELDDYIEKIGDSEVLDSYIEVSKCDELAAANPDISLALFLQKRGVSVAVAKTTSVSNDGLPSKQLSVRVDPAIQDAYRALLHEMFEKSPRRVANAIARGDISPNDAFPQQFHMAPIVNRDILWAYDQGILPRAFLTSIMFQYFELGADESSLGNVRSAAPLVERLMTEVHLSPFALETVLGMGEAVAAATLWENPEFAEQLHLDPRSLPSVEFDHLEIKGDDWDAAFEAYWKPAFEKAEGK